MEESYKKTSMFWGTGKTYAENYKQEDETKTQSKLVFHRLGLKSKESQHKSLKKFLEPRNELSLGSMGQANYYKWMKGPNEKWPVTKRVQTNVRWAFQAYINEHSNSCPFL